MCYGIRFRRFLNIGSSIGMSMKRYIAAIGIVIASVQFAAADFKTGLKAYEAENYTVALSEWLRAASTGDANAQLNLGVIYENGVPGTKKDLIEALAWYRLAAAQNVAAGTEAHLRLAANMNKNEIEQAEDRSVMLMGKWFRRAIGRDEAEYQSARKQHEQRAKAKISREKAVAKARAERQRTLVAQRDADARLAEQLEKESKVAAIRAAQEKAEEAKRLALIKARREEEEKRLAQLKSEQSKQRKLETAKARLEALKQKAKTGTVSDATVTRQIAEQQKSVQPAAAPAATATTTPTATPTVSKIATAPKRVASIQPTASARKVVAPVADLPVPQTDNPVIAGIFADAKSVDLETDAARSEIRSGKMNIEALKWTLISAARGDASSIHMGDVFKREMSPVQIAEASRLAAIWINKRN